MGAAEPMGDEWEGAEQMVEHLTVPGFLRRIAPHRWHLDDITRFGSQAGRAADALQLSYVTTIDRQLGMLRTFPVPFLMRVYEVMAPKHGWPAATAALPGPGARFRSAAGMAGRGELAKHLETLLPVVQGREEVLAALEVVLEWLGGGASPTAPSAGVNQSGRSRKPEGASPMRTVEANAEVVG